MKRIVNIASVLLLACVAFISCEREGRPVVQEESRPIVFAVDGEWPEITKIPVYDVETIKEAGFRVWGTWHQDPDDPAVYTFDPEVFGEDGTLVSCKEGNESLLPEQEARWHRGYYSFAAVFPNSLSGTLSKNELNIELARFNLAAEQTDIMFAFADVDNSESQASTVNLDFYHVFALLNVRLTNQCEDAFDVKALSLYGIHDTIHDDLQLTYSSQISPVTDNLDDLLSEASVTTAERPYFEREYTDGQCQIDSDESLAIVDNLLVFPETLSEPTVLTIKLVLQYGEQTKEFVATISDTEWERGDTYTYELAVDSSMFSTAE